MVADYNASMAYLTLKAPAEAEIEIKKSRFLAHALPVDSRQTALAHVADLKQHHPDARHHCWAYLLGDPAGSASAGMDDDGEPSGTAGRPILGVLQDRGVGNALIVVVRWFGGIKLGASGLTRAYRQAAAAALDAAELIERRPVAQAHIHIPFEQEASLRHHLAQLEGTWLETAYTASGLQATVQLPQDHLKALRQLAARMGLTMN